MLFAFGRGFGSLRCSLQASTINSDIGIECLWEIDNVISSFILLALLKRFVVLRVETECERIPCSSAVSFFMVR